MTHASATYHPWIPRAIAAPLLVAALLLAACGGERSSLPPAPTAAGTVAIANLARHPEVYADATLATVGTVERTGTPSAPLYQLLGGHGTRIVLEPATKAAPYAGRRVRATGIFTVTFKLGYEILISQIRPAGSL